jgi:outer membrane protein OmpA-like peptidoglycan-associated protein
MRTLLIFILSVTFYYQSFSQEEPDTLIYAQGKILSASSGRPVSAKITYKSLPYGSKNGFLSGDSYSFPLFDNEKYSIEVVSPGYAPAKFMLDPATANAQRLVIKDIELVLPNSAAQVAETTHTPGKVMRLDNLIFNVGTSKIESSSFEELDDVVKMLHDNPNMIIQLEGHTDVKGAPGLNMKLSEDRVNAVKDYLVSKGANKARIKTRAFGGTQPLSKENTEEAHKLNRRVELRVLQN